MTLAASVQKTLDEPEKITADGPYGYRWELRGLPFLTGNTQMEQREENRGVASMTMELGQVLVRP